MVQYTEWRSISDGSIISSIPDSAVVHVPMDEGSGSTASDQLGDADMTLETGTSWDETADGFRGHRVELDGSQGYLSVAESDLVEVGDTGSIFITVENRDNDQDGRPWDLGNNDGQSPNFFFELEDGTDVRVRINDIDETIDWNPSENTLYRTAFVWDGGDWWFYVNGSLVDSGTYTDGPITTDNGHRWAFGRRTDQSSRHLDGYLDNFILSDGAEDNSVVQTDYEAQPFE